MAGAVNFRFADDDLHAFLQRLQAMDSCMSGTASARKRKLAHHWACDELRRAWNKDWLNRSN
jgi:hypothetical protein